ncbi:hypothetical protein [Amycolatopsis sp. NPDC052450]|uniref:hypothetical protein n=1 Tax=Amycolatopsis sp. NPDC052450 TaxID=3363937 RepID=UPI0037C7C632
MATKELVDAFNVLTLQTVLADQEQLPDIVGHVHGELLDFRFSGEAPEQVFPHAGVHVVRRRSELVHRIKMAGVLLRLEYDTQLTGGDLSGIKAAQDKGQLIFSSSEHLLNGATFLDVYVGPLMGAASPAIWNLHAAREFGIVVYSLGRFIVAPKDGAAEMLHFLPIRGSLESVPTPTIRPGACSTALDWWGAKLNNLFGVLTDPVTFTDQAGRYVPVKHLQAISTVEQLFKRITSLQAAHRDLTARRVLFFSVMDTLHRLTGRPIEKHCSLQFATETLERLRAAISAEAAEVLLPAAERAVTALRKVQDGFYLARQFGRDEIDVVNNGAATGKLNLEDAASEYLEMLRNATHGFGSNKSRHVGLTNTLLAHHDGDVPHDIGFLGYLYLLDLVSQPETLRGALYRGGRL